MKLIYPTCFYSCERENGAETPKGDCYVILF